MSKRLSSFLTIGILGVSFSAASAQINASNFANDLRAKYGPPLLREVFVVRPGEMIVDYSASGHVCRIQLPAMGPDSHQPGVESTQAVDDFLLELLPPIMRGKELNRMIMMFGAPSVSSVEYENLTISESLQGNRRTGITVSFRNEPCQRLP